MKTRYKLILFISFAFIIGSLSDYLFEGSVKEISLSAERTIYKLEKKKDVIFKYINDEFCTFIILDDNGLPQTFSMVKRLGLWVYDFPSNSNIYGITTIKNNLYYYNLCYYENVDAIYLKSKNGTKIEPLKQTKLEINNSIYLAYVFEIKNYINNKGSYQIIALDKDGNDINVNTNEFEEISIELSLIKDNTPKLLTYSTDDLLKFNDDRAKLKEVLIKTINNKKPIEPIVFEGCKLPNTQKDVFSETTLGEYIKIEGKNKVFKWNHEISYHIILNGDYKNILIRSDTNYFNNSLFEEGINNNSLYYKLGSSKKLDRLFDLFFQ